MAYLLVVQWEASEGNLPVTTHFRHTAGLSGWNETILPGMPAPPPSLETRIESGVLSVRFDGGHWIALEHGVSRVLSVEDCGGEPRAGAVTYRNTWGLVQTLSFFLKAPRRLG